MKPEGLRFRYRELISVLGVISLLVLEACSNLPLPGFTPSSQSDSDVPTTSADRENE